MRLTAELISASRIFLNPALEREIDLRGRRIPVIENLGALRDQIDVLDVTDNEIERLENFPKLLRLKWILASNNRISRLHDNLFSSLPNLRVLVLANNRISMLSEIDKLACLKHLEVLNLEDNPVQKREHYRLYVVHHLPSVNLLDLDRVRRKDRLAAEEMFASSAGREMLQGVRNQAEVMAVDDANAGLVLSTTQKAALQRALMAATTQAEVDRLDKMLRAGVVPDAATLVALGLGGEDETGPTVEPANGSDMEGVTAQSEATKDDAVMSDSNENMPGTVGATAAVDVIANATEEPSAPPLVPASVDSASARQAPSETVGTAQTLHQPVPPSHDAPNAQAPTPTQPEDGVQQDVEMAESGAGSPIDEKEDQEAAQPQAQAAPSTAAAAAPDVSESSPPAQSSEDTSWVLKLKVAELRAELKSRDLDTKGLKAVLQKRLITSLAGQ